MKLRTFLLGATLASLAGIVLVPSAQSQACRQYGGVVSPTSETRVYSNQQLGFSFKLPANYRAMAISRGSIEVLDPNSFEWTQCIIRNREATELKLSPVAVHVKPVNSSVRSLEKQIRTQYPWVNAKFSSTTVSNQAALTASYNEILSGELITDVYFLTPDKTHLVRLTGPAQGKLLNLALSSFAFK